MVGRVWKRRDREGWGGREDRVGKKERRIKKGQEGEEEEGGRGD